jgi:D-amino peptidase
MTRLLIVADMEGVSGIDSYEQTHQRHPSYQHGVRLLCQEINVIARAAFETGAQSVSVMDLHGGGGNLDPELLDDRVPIVPEDLSPGYDLAFLVGFHPMAGDPTGFISHTMTHGVALAVNGSQIGELALFGWWLGEHGVPIGLISGDRAATAEANRFFPDTPTLSVKQAESWSRATCVPVEQAYEALSARVTRIMQQRERLRVYPPPEQLAVRIRLREANPFVHLIPWLTEGDDGWLTGAVEKAHDLIDLLDVISALIDLQLLDNVYDHLGEDPRIAQLMDQLARERIEKSINSGHWLPK